MTCKVVTDTSALIDLGKGNLLEVLCRLPYEFILPKPLRENELLDYSDEKSLTIDSAGIITVDVSTDQVVRSSKLKKQYNRLSLNDCICLVLNEDQYGILLTGDSEMRRVANAKGMDCHGVLWVVEELEKMAVGRSRIIEALKAWKLDSGVYLPEGKVNELLTRFQHQR